MTWFGETVQEPDRSKMEAKFRDYVFKQLAVEPQRQGQVVVTVCGGKEFLGERLSLEAMANLFPREEPLFEEIPAIAPGTAQEQDNGAE